MTANDEPVHSIEGQKELLGMWLAEKPLLRKGIYTES